MIDWPNSDSTCWSGAPDYVERQQAEIDRLTAALKATEHARHNAGQTNQQLISDNARLRAALEDALLMLEIQAVAHLFGKKAEPGSLIYQIRKALANEQTAAPTTTAASAVHPASKT